MDAHIQGLVSSVVNAKIYGTQDFTVDLASKFVEPSRYEHPVSEWNRYVNYMRGLKLRQARDAYWFHRDKELLAEDFMIAYYEASLMRKEFAQ